MKSGFEEFCYDVSASTSRWTGAREASSSTCSYESRLDVIAAPGQLNRYADFEVMRVKHENEELFELIGRSGQMWLAQARQLKMAADSILPNLVEAFRIPPALPGAQDKRFAFFHSYMLLIGLSFENLTKGILIERDPTLVAKDRIESGILARGGHGIAEAVRGIIKVSSDEFQLLRRVEEYLFWAGRYPLPLKSSIYHNSETQDLRSGRSDDPQSIDRLFQRLEEVLERETNSTNRTVSA